MIKKMLYFILIIFFLFGCQDIKRKTIKKDDFKSQSSVVLEKSINTFYLSNENVMEFLLDYGKKHKEKKIRIYTDYGNIEIELFESTKFHRSNFIYLIKKKYFDETQFYRVINNFIIQGGNSDDKKTLEKRKKIGRYLLPNDNKKEHKHHRVMISMPSSAVSNPYKMASPFEFFIVLQKGGAHQLDGDYTVFGRVTRGMDIVDKIAAVPTDDGDWPEQNIYLNKVEIIY